MIEMVSIVGLIFTLVGWAAWLRFTLRYATPPWSFGVIAIEGIVAAMCALQMILLLVTLLYQWQASLDLMDFAVFKWPYFIAAGIAAIFFRGVKVIRAILYMAILFGQTMLCYATLHNILGAV